MSSFGRVENRANDSIFFQNQWIRFTDYPQRISYNDIEHAINEINSLIALAYNEAATLKQASLFQFKGQFHLQLGLNNEALSAYNEALGLLDKHDDPVLRVKVNCGLGQLALEEQGQEEAAREFFTSAYNRPGPIEFPMSMVWIFYHNGGRFLTNQSYGQVEIGEINKYMSREVYTNPRKALELSEWLIRKGGDNYRDIHYAYIAKGLVHRNWGEMDLALEYFIQAQEFAESKELPADYIFNSMLNITAVYLIQGQFVPALNSVLEVAEKAEKGGYNRTLAFALKDLGIINMQMERYDESKAYFLKAIPAMSEIGNRQGVGICHSNLVLVYLQKGEYTNSENSADLALRILKETHYEELYAATLLGKCRLYMKTGEWSRIRPLLLEALEIVKGLEAGTHIHEAYQLLAEYHIHTGEARTAGQYYDSLRQSVEIYFDKERVEISENLKARYETEKKEARLALQLAENQSLAIENNAQRKQRNVLLFLALTFIILLVLLANRFQLRKKLAVEQEARLTDKVRVSELEQARKEAENKLLEEQVQHKQRELASLTLQMAQKNDALEELELNIKRNMSQNQAFSEVNMKQVLNLIGNQKTIDKDWHVFKAHFEDVHPAFFEKIRTSHTGLSQTEEKHCAYMRMGLSTKEIARLMNISPSSVQVSRYRLKKKMGLSKEEDIYQHVNSI